MTDSMDSCLVPVDYPRDRAGKKALKAISCMTEQGAMELAGVVIAKVCNSNGCEKEIFVVELENCHYRIDVRQIFGKDVEAAIQEGLEIRRGTSND